MIKSASISKCGKYRALLSRQWSEEAPPAVFVMLNPSTADAEADDPTIRRCIGFAKSWGAGGVIVANLFQLRSTDPKALIGAEVLNPPDANWWLWYATDQGSPVVAAWGALAKPLEFRAQEVEALARSWGRPLKHLGLTKNGSPRHPLYLRADARPEQFGAHP